MFVISFGEAKETYSRTRRVIISVACHAWVTDIIAICVEPRHHGAVTLQNIVDFLFSIMLVRFISTSWSKVHDEHARHHLGYRELIPFASGSTHKQFVKCCRGVTAHPLELYVISICHH